MTQSAVPSSAPGYVTPQAAVQALRPGWKIVGQKPYEVEVPNTNRVTASDPSTIKQTQGTIYSIEGPNGEPDTVTLSQAVPVASGGGKGGIGYTVITGPGKNPNTGGNKPSDTSRWVTVYRTPGDPNSGVIGQWDPVNSELHATGAEPNAKPSGKYDNVSVPNADGTTRMVGMVDTGDKSFHPVSADPTTQKRTIQTPTAIYSVDDNDNVKKLVDVDKTVPFQAVNIDGAVYRFDPNEKDPTKALVKVGPDAPLPKQLTQNGVTYVLTTQEDGSQKYTLPPGVKTPSALQSNTTARTLDWYDSEGNLVKSVPNTNYQAPQTQLPSPNTSAPNILVPDPDNPGKLKWIPNEGKVTASKALQDLASHLSGQVVDANMTVDEAKAIIDGANQQMQTAMQAGGATLTNIQNAAQVGAGLLQNRVTNAQQFVQQGMGILGQTKHGLLVAPEGDFGANLTQGAAAFATALGGGEDVYKAAANLVRRADPNGAMGQDAANAYAALGQMFQHYRQVSGGVPHPAEAAASGTGGMGAPSLYNPQASTAAMNAAGFQDTPQGRAAAMAANPALLQTPQPPTVAAPEFVAPAGPPAGQNYGANVAYTGGVAPWNAVPGPSFVAPPAMPNLPPAPKTITVSVG